MRKILNIVFYKDINKYLHQEKLNLFVVIKDNEYYVKELRPDFNYYQTSLKDYLCYNYDELSIYNKLITEDKVINLININNNVYVKKK